MSEVHEGEQESNKSSCEWARQGHSELGLRTLRMIS